MSPTKEKVIRVIQALPDDVTLDDILAELYFRLQLEKALRQQIPESERIAHSELKQTQQRQDHQ